MIKLKDILLNLFEASANANSYSADEGEPDTGFIRGGKRRKLGGLAGKPEDWFDNGGYTQLEFPEADHIMGKGTAPDYEVTKKYKGDNPGKIKEGLLKEGKVLSIFDFDDTLVKSLSWIYIKKNGKEIKKLDAAEFAVYKLKAGEEFDFRDFDKKIQNPKLINRNVNLLKRQLSKHGRKVTILTARKLGLPVTSFLKTIGIDAYVVPLGTADPKKKAEYIEKEIKKGYNPIYFMDDSSKNIRAVDTLKKKYPQVKLVTKLVK